MSTFGGVYAGSYYGGGYSGGTYGNKVASRTNLNRVTRDIASGYANDFEIIQRYFKSGKTDEALDKYEGMFDDVQATANEYGYSLDDSQIQTILNDAYKSTTGSTMVSAASENADSSFASGLAQGIPLFGTLFANGTSEQEALAELSGDKVSAKEYVKEGAGALVSSIGITSAVSTAASFLPKETIANAVGVATNTALKNAANHAAKKGLKQAAAESAKAFFKNHKVIGGIAKAVTKVGGFVAAHPVAACAIAAGVALIGVIGKNTNWFGYGDEK